MKDFKDKVAVITGAIGNAGVNIDLIYFAGLNRLIIGVDDLEKAKAALK